MVDDNDAMCRDGGIGTLFTNARLAGAPRDASGVWPVGCVGVRNGAIVEIAFDTAVLSTLPYQHVVDCSGYVLSMGLCEIQFNGGWGMEFTTAALTARRLLEVAALLPSMGITSFLPTLVSCSVEVYSNALGVTAAAMEAQRLEGSARGAEILGLHLEGPFLEAAKRGAHAKERLVEVLSPASKVIATTYGSAVDSAVVKLVTLAPGLRGATEMTEELVRRGIVVSLGHSNATLEQGAACLRSGATALTHLYNAMRGFHHREPGLVGLVSETVDAATSGAGAAAATRRLPRPFYELIADGHHVHSAAIALAYKAHPRGAILTTDSSPLIGLPDGATRTFSEMYEHTVEVRGGRALVLGTETIAGGCCGMIGCVNNLIAMTGCALDAALATATLHPAQLLGIERSKGALRVGADADFVFLDDARDSGGGDAVVLVATWVRGVELWRRA